MKEIDKTKQNLRVNEIDDSQRKDLFNKFKDAGGQVISDRDARRSLVIDRDKQKQHQQRLDEHYSNKRVPSNQRVVSQKKISSAMPVRSSSAFDRFRIRMRLRILGVTGFNTVFFKNSFFQKFNDYYKPSLIEIQMIFLSLYKKDPKTGNRIIRSLDRISPIYYELCENAGDLYQPILIDQILDSYRNFPDIPQPLSELRDSINELFRPLFILKSYENSILNSFEKAIDMSISYSEGKKDKNIRKKDLKNALFVVFDKLYPRLHTIFCHYHGILFTETDKVIEEILSIYQSEKPGNRVRRDDSRSVQVDYAEEPDLQIDSEQPDEKVIENDSVKEGLKLMYRLDINSLRSIYDKKGEFELLNNTDKVLLAYLLFLEFEKEYSFILTTNKIKYNIDFSTNVKIDYRIKMQDIFNQLKKCQDAFRSYYDTFIEYNKIFNQKPMNNNQYIAYSKRLDEIAKKKKQAGSMSRMVIKSLMDNLAAEFEVLIDDMNGRMKFISNPQDILEFSYEIEGEKKLKNKKIYEAIEIIYNYASALSHRISSEGDLSGKLEFDENEKQPENRDSGEPKTVKTEGSIFDELDDII
ncbi:MAG: hypothetical protein CVV49_05915 [Spirochaetae bacterium HGW-Spirochaetae-5]|nr:MAG: hypothetical protein CVV49_05915 [Spirochaetae bacterium HGW-Spirochaetae-5]